MLGTTRGKRWWSRSRVGGVASDSWVFVSVMRDLSRGWPGYDEVFIVVVKIGHVCASPYRWPSGTGVVLDPEHLTLCHYCMK